MKPRMSFIVLLAVGGIFESCKGPEGPAGPRGPAGGGGVESLTDPSIQPKVLYTYPPANSVGPYRFPGSSTQLQLRFNKIMDRGSLQHAIGISSPNTKVRIDTSGVFPFGDDFWILSPYDSGGYSYSFKWRVAETYTLRIAGTAKDVNGNFLNPPYSMTFEPEPYFRVVSQNPPDGAIDVRTSNLISIVLNSPIDTSIYSKIHITPPLNGSWWTYYDSVYLYYTAFPYALNTHYTLTIDASARDKYGNTLQHDFVTSFTTIGFRVDYTYPSNGDGGIFSTSWIRVVFTGGIDTGTVRGAFSIDPSVPGFFSNPYNTNPYDIRFVPSPQLMPGTAYTVTVDTSLRGANGETLSSPYQFSFATAPFLVTRTDPPNGYVDVSRYSSVAVYCNALIDSSSTRAAFSLKDSTGAVVDGGTYSNPSYPYFWFYPSAPFAPAMLYTGAISTALKAIGGVQLGTRYTFQFKTSR